MSSASGSIRHTGYFDGQLHCEAVRHGWTRSFSISAEELEVLDYDSLAGILELATLKLRSNALKIFVESPADSGTFCKLQYWRDDGSLQSVLVKDFFQSRFQENSVLRFEIRDGRERAIDIAVDDLASSEGHGHGNGIYSKPSRNRSLFSLDWLSSMKRSPRTQATTLDTDAGGSAQNRIFRLFNFLFAPRSRRKAYMQQPQGDADETTPLRAAEEPGVLMESAHPPASEPSAFLAASKKPSLRQKLLDAAYYHGPFFSSGGPHRSVGHPDPTKEAASKLGSTTSPPDPPHALRDPSSQPTPIEEVSMWEAESTTAGEDASGREAPPGLITAFWRAFWAPAARPTSSMPDVPPANGTGKSPAAQKMKRIPKQPQRKPDKAAADQHFKGASVIRRPEDAFPARADSAVSGLFSAGDDPFRG